MKNISKIFTLGTILLGFGVSTLPVLAEDDIGENCVPVSVKMAVGPGNCEVLDYAVKSFSFQKAFYPWTNIEGSLFNCEAIGEWMIIEQPVLWPDGLVMPTSLSGYLLEGTLGEAEVAGTIACAGHQNNFYQPFLSPDISLPFIRTENVSIARMDVDKGKNKTVSVHVAFSGAGLLHLEDPETFHIGASTSGSVVGLVIESGNKLYVSNNADGHLQVQGHIFEPDDPNPGMLTGYICDDNLAKLVDWDDEDADE